MTSAGALPRCEPGLLILGPGQPRLVGDVVSRHPVRPSDALVGDELSSPLRYRLYTSRKREHQLAISFLGKFRESRKIGRAPACRFLGEYVGAMLESGPDCRWSETRFQRHEHKLRLKGSQHLSRIAENTHSARH